MSRMFKFISVFAMLTLLAMAIVTPALAFESREGQNIVIEKDEVVEDDLYVFAETVTVNGTIKGDLIAFGTLITVNGTVEGDVMAAGQAVVINGNVKDDARIAGAGLQVGSDAVIGDDLIAAGASLETREGSQVGGDLVVGSAQFLLAGDVTGDVIAGSAGVELRGAVGGDVKAYVDMTSDSEQMPPMNMYMTDMPISIPSVPAGLTVDDSARIAGNLEYTSTFDLNIPTSVVGGKVTRTEPEREPRVQYVEPTPAEKVTTWALNLLRFTITLILFGLFLGWLFPKFMNALPENLRTKPWASLGWGAITWALFWFALLAIILVTIFGGILFGVLTLGTVTGTIIWVGIVLLIALTVGFILVTSYLTKIVVGTWIGEWILNRLNPSVTGHKVWPMVLGVIIVTAVVGLLNFPLIPLGFFGWLLNFVVILFGLGALWLWGREKFAKQPSA